MGDARLPLRALVSLCALWALGLASAGPARAVDYGVTADAGLSRGDLDRMQDAGVDVLRLGIDWGRVQRAQGGRYDWRRLDELILGASDRGIEVIPRIYGMPRRDEGDRSRHLLGMPTSRGELRSWRRFFGAAIGRYGTSGSIWQEAEDDVTPPVAVTTWQVSFQPAARAPKGMSKQQRNSLTRAYNELLSSARRVAEDSDRAAEVAADIEVVRSAGGSGRVPRGAVIRGLARASAVRDKVATVTVRPRGRPGKGLERDMERFRNVLARVGLGDSRLIVAPIGWASDRRLSKTMSVGRRRQATLLRNSFELIGRNQLEWGVESVIWSAWQDGSADRSCTWCRKSGLLDRRGRQKPSFDAFKALASAADAGAVPGLDPAAANHEFFGVQPSIPITDSDAQVMAAAGVGTVRQVIYWEAVQPGGQGPMRWDEIDPLFERLAVQGIKTFPVLLGDRNRVSELISTGLPGWRAFVAAVVDRYGPGGAFWTSFAAEHPEVDPRPPTTWQVWNEQNSMGFWRPEPSVEDYASLLSTSADAIRSEDPTAQIVLGGMYGYSNMNADDFLRGLYGVPGAAEDFDVVAAHPYGAGNAAIATQIEALREEMQLQGDGQTPMWITETGWASEPVDDPDYDHLGLSEQGQADALDAAFRMLIAQRQTWGIRGIHWYSWRDSDVAACIFCQYTGLLRNDGTGKPSLDAFRALAAAGL